MLILVRGASSSPSAASSIVSGRAKTEIVVLTKQPRRREPLFKRFVSEPGSAPFKRRFNPAAKFANAFAAVRLLG